MAKNTFSKDCIGSAIFISLCFLNPMSRASQNHETTLDLTQTIQTVQKGKTSSIRTDAAHHLFKLTRAGTQNINDKAMDKMTSLLDSPDDSVRYWIARTLGNFGRRARKAVPKLQEVLGQVDCIEGSKTSASGIRLALKQIGVTPPPEKCDKQQVRVGGWSTSPYLQIEGAPFLASFARSENQRPLLRLRTRERAFSWRYAEIEWSA